ncbi:MAG: prepilin-type N-terminal cleavage/methylation domain-containing protein [Clostridia bacterium]|nr:prepilin-type N-terminal cleavage/methylation domain-containing protein [Clostridia bacterium]
MSIMKAVWKAQRRRERNEAGFTFLEVMAVVAVIAILAILIVPRILASLDTAKKNTDDSNLNMLQGAVERYHFDKGSYPTGTDADAAITELINAGYIDKKPKCETGSWTYADGKFGISR